MVRLMKRDSEADARLSQLEAARQQNLLNMQQMRQFLEAAQQKELQYKAAQELHQQQLLIEKQNANRLNIPQVQQQMVMQQHSQDIRTQLPGSIAERGIGSFVGQQQNQQQ
ncbi:hypothetical protein CDAR_531261 [Caerostris darwini]|uniref:Uncharacterized protein n=1 Tax=Caerostris darwini TaxID=1538125 RepID=A0AAV4TWX8_9ARAC|nr:hypothetical protein CDAR_531261 [Caerostris darwini]